MFLFTKDPRNQKLLKYKNDTWILVLQLYELTLFHKHTNSIYNKNQFMPTLEQRMLKLERRLRMYQIAVVAIIIAGCFFALTAFNGKTNAPDLIQAKEFQVVDNQGKVLISLKKDVDAGAIKLFDETGSNTIEMKSSDGGTGVIATKNKSGNVACQMSSYKDDAGKDDGSGRLLLYNKDGKMVDEIGSTSNANGVFLVKNTEGIKISELGSTETGGGWLGVFNSEGKEVGEMSQTDAKTGYIGLNNVDGSTMFKVTYTSSTNGGWMGLYNNYGKNIFRVSSADNGGRASIFDNNENEMVHLGIASTNDGIVSVFNHLNNRICVLGPDDNSNGVLNVLNSAGQNMNGVWPK